MSSIFGLFSVAWHGLGSSSAAGAAVSTHGQDAGKNLVVCPLHHDQDFMQIFYEAWRIVQAFIESDARVPKEVSLPRPVDREVARILEERRDFPVVEVVDAIKVFGQLELLVSDDKQVGLRTLKGETQTEMLVAPLPLGPDLFDT